MRFCQGIAAAAFTLAMATASVAVSQTYSVDAHVLSAGTSVLASSPCYRLQAVIAEPIAGYSSSADYSFSAGFRAVLQGSASDDIFFNGFEDCTP